MQELIYEEQEIQNDAWLGKCQHRLIVQHVIQLKGQQASDEASRSWFQNQKGLLGMGSRNELLISETDFNWKMLWKEIHWITTDKPDKAQSATVHMNWKHVESGRISRFACLVLIPSSVFGCRHFQAQVAYILIWTSIATILFPAL